MRKKFFDRTGKSIIAVLTSVVLATVMIISVPGVTTWADSVFDTATHHFSEHGGVAEVWDDANGRQMPSTGTIPAGSVIAVSDTCGCAILGWDGLAEENICADGRTYTLTRNVSYSVADTNVSLAEGPAGGASAAGESAAGGDAEGNGVVAGPTAAQIAWAQFHDHAHNGNTGGFVWEQTVATTEYSDGEVIYRCPECGYIERTTGGDAYDFFNDSFIRQVRVGKPGQTITIEAGQWISFNKALIDALRNNREITTNIIYKSNGVLSTLTIPRGTDFSNVPEDKYTGIDYLAYCLGIVPVPKFG